jgi:hypothetical protein
MPLQEHAINRHGLPRAIPEPIKLQVRRRCGFGCVVCGIGLYDYEHFAPEYKNALAHDAEGITLLCPNHHAQKTRNRLSIQTIERCNANPKAMEQGFANDMFDFSSNKPVVVFRLTTFDNVEVILRILDEPILSILPSQDRHEPFLLSAKLRDIKVNISLEVDKNEWKSPNTNWDCRTEGSTIYIRSAPKNIELLLRQEPPNKIIIERLRMKHRGFTIVADENSGLTLSTQSNQSTWNTSAMVLSNFRFGFMLDKDGVVYLRQEQIGPGPSSFLGGPNGGRLIT